MNNIARGRPQTVILQIGGNDFSGTIQDDYLKTSYQWHNLSFIINRGVKLVFIGKRKEYSPLGAFVPCNISTKY
jgi:hypothetical protein